MKVEVEEDRKVYCAYTAGTQNENEVTELKIEIPEKYKDFNKKIVFITDDGTKWDIIENNTYKLTKAITKYKSVKFYIWLTKGDVDFRSIEKTLIFNSNTDANVELTQEEINGINKVLKIVEEEITEATQLEKELKELIANIQYKLENGEFKGEKGDKGEDGHSPIAGQDYFTEADKQAIVEEITEDIEGAKDNFDKNVEEKINAFNSNAESELDKYNSNAEDAINEFNENASDYKKRIAELEAENQRLREDMTIAINSAVSDKVTESKMDTAIKSAVANINKKEIVTSLDEMTDTNTIYLIANDGKENNIYDEYIVINEKAEKIGTTEVDLTDYIKNTDIENLKAKEINSNSTNNQISTAKAVYDYMNIKKDVNCVVQNVANIDAEKSTIRYTQIGNAVVAKFHIVTLGIGRSTAVFKGAPLPADYETITDHLTVKSNQHLSTLRDAYVGPGRWFFNKLYFKRD